jgi:hypothetical protein
LEKLGPFEPIQRQPDQALVGRQVQLLVQPRSYLLHGGLAIALLPDEAGCLVEAVSLIPGEVVNQEFSR